jgi:hypothetical protein
VHGALASHSPTSASFLDAARDERKELASRAPSIPTTAPPRPIRVVDQNRLQSEVSERIDDLFWRCRFGMPTNICNSLTINNLPDSTPRHEQIATVNEHAALGKLAELAMARVRIAHDD